MFQRLREKRQDEGGFTLIELLVVILIIAILAAIAIPVFLRQREKGWRAQTQSALKNAATAEESWATAHNGQYSGDLAELEGEGLKYATDVTVTPTAASAGATSFCIDAVHANLSAEPWSYDSDVGEPVEGTC
jgi:type IV pilus assembly protein PilA